MTPATAEAIAVRALGWMAERDDVMEIFLSATGAAPDDLRTQARDPHFLGFVLDHLLGQDQWVLDFAAMSKIEPSDVMSARAHLPGGDIPNWT